jgi:hypothetical protein
MGAVDVHDHLRESYPIARITHKWWMSVFYFLIDMALTNAYVACRMVRPDLSHLNFLESLALDLIGHHTSRKVMGRPPKKRRR